MLSLSSSRNIAFSSSFSRFILNTNSSGTSGIAHAMKEVIAYTVNWNTNTKARRAASMFQYSEECLYG